jgi:hypothetical protein
VLPLAIALLLAFPGDGRLYMTSDGMEYTSAAMRVARGQWAHVDGSPFIRRPLFLLYIAAWFRLLGYSLMTSFLAFRLFYVLNALLVYALGKRLYGGHAGLVASLLVLSSSAITGWSSLTVIDHVLAFFMILSVLLVYLAFEHKTHLRFVLAGVSLAAAFLVKEMAILFFPLPVLAPLVVRAYRCRRCLWGTALQLSVVAILTVPWMAYVYSVDPAMILGRRAGFVSASLQVGSSALDMLSQTLMALPNYYTLHLAPHFVLAPLLAIAWGYTWISALRGGKADRVIGLAILLFCPLLVFQGRVGFRPRLAMGLILLLYIALAGCLSAAVRQVLRLSERFLAPDRASLARATLPIIIPLVAIVVQAGMDRAEDLVAFVGRFNTLAFLGRGEWQLEHRGRAGSMQVADWFEENVPAGSALLGWESEQRTITYFSAGRYGFWQVPVVYSDDGQFSYRPTGRGVVALLSDQRGNQYVQSLEYSQLAAITEDHLEALIRDASIDYLVSGRIGVLSHYLANSPSFVKVGDIGCGRTQVFEVLPFEPYAPDPLVTEDAVTFLGSLRTGSPEKYQWLVEDFFGSRLGWTARDVDGIYQRDTVPRFGGVSVRKYAQAVEASGKLGEALALHRYKAELQPQNPWPHVTLGTLYLKQGDREAALDSFERAVEVARDYRAVVRCIGIGVREPYVPLYLTQRENYRSPVLTETVGAESVYVTYRLLDQLSSAEMAFGSEHRDVRLSAFVAQGEPRGVLFQHPTSRVSYGLRLPADGQLRFGVALSPEAWRARDGDGVQFDIHLEEGSTRWRLFSDYVDPKSIRDDRRWHDHEVDLSHWSGKAVTVTFSTSPGPDEDYRFDWAGWSEPRVVQPIAFDFLSELPNADVGDADERYVREEILDLDFEPRPILFQHPTSRVTYRLELPRGAGLHFGLGMDPAAWQPDGGDGAEYNVYVRTGEAPLGLRRVFHRHITPRSDPAHRHWLDYVVDLSAFGGQTVDIIFEALPGPAGDANSDWGGWSLPVLVGDDMALYPGAEVAPGARSERP